MLEYITLTDHNHLFIHNACFVARTLIVFMCYCSIAYINPVANVLAGNWP